MFLDDLTHSVNAHFAGGALPRILKNFDLQPFDVLMVLVWLGVFFSLYRILAKVLFAPYMTLLERREAATSGAEHAAAAVAAEAAGVRKKYDQDILEVRIAAMQKKLKALNEARAEAQKISEDAAERAQEQLGQVRMEIGKRIDALRAKAANDVDGMVEKLVTKLKNPPEIAEIRLN